MTSEFVTRSQGLVSYMYIMYNIKMSGQYQIPMFLCFPSVRCIRGKASHFATELYKSMKGLGTDDDRLCRVIVSRCEVDMVQIKEEFQKQYKQTLGMFLAVSNFTMHI